MTFAERMVRARKAREWTQSEVAERLGVSFQAVSLWERGETLPETEKLMDIAALYDVSLDWLLNGKAETDLAALFQDALSERIFREEKMYTYISTYARAKGMFQTARALPFARKCHLGQERKGKEHVPYIYHPLLIACHALSLQLSDEAVAAALLHDVCEDCGVAPEELPVSPAVQQAVALLTKRPDLSEEAYYSRIGQDPIAAIVKLLDRCNNVSSMPAAFSKEKMAAYIQETEKYVLPLAKHVKENYPELSNALFLVRYHMLSVLETVKRML